jgi:hypothetical protein
VSWSVSFIGTPKAVVKALEGYALHWAETDQSRKEYEAAKPHLIGLVEQNVAIVGAIVLHANGHASVNAAGEKTYGTCYVNLATQGGALVTEE